MTLGIKERFYKNIDILINWQGCSMKIRNRKFIVDIQEFQRQQYKRKYWPEIKLPNFKIKIKIKINGLMNLCNSNSGRKDHFTIKSRRKDDDDDVYFDNLFAKMPN